jgi:hypothetical protein
LRKTVNIALQSEWTPFLTKPVAMEALRSRIEPVGHPSVNHDSALFHALTDPCKIFFQRCQKFKCGAINSSANSGNGPLTRMVFLATEQTPRDMANLSVGLSGESPVSASNCASDSTVDHRRPIFAQYMVAAHIAHGSKLVTNVHCPQVLATVVQR